MEAKQKSQPQRSQTTKSNNEAEQRNWTLKLDRNADNEANRKSNNRTEQQNRTAERQNLATETVNQILIYSHQTVREISKWISNLNI